MTGGPWVIIKGKVLIAFLGRTLPVPTGYATVAPHPDDTDERWSSNVWFFGIPGVAGFGFGFVDWPSR